MEVGRKKGLQDAEVMPITKAGMGENIIIQRMLRLTGRGGSEETG